MTLEQLVEQGKVEGALVRVKGTGVLGRVTKTSDGSVLVQEGTTEELTSENRDVFRVFPYALHELELVAEPAPAAPAWWYLSFAEEKFNGACIVLASDMIEAVRETHRSKINPGGQVIGHPIPEDAIPEEKYRNRLLSKADLQEMLPHEEVMTERERKGARR